MKAKSFQINALTSQLQHDCDAVVLYGTDEGEINYVLSQLKQVVNSFSKDITIQTISKESFKKTPFIATDEANTPSLIASRRILVVLDDTPFTAPALLHFLDNKQTDALLIIQAGNLSKSNALRLEAEQNPRVLAISCYQPTLLDIQKSITSFLALHHKKIAPSVLSELCQKIPFNQQIMEQELNKLLIYLGDKNEVTSEDIQNCLVDGSETSLENLCICLADGRVEAVQQEIDLFITSHEPETTLFWSVRDYFERLLAIVSNTSEPVAVVVKKNLRPAQFRLEKPLIQQARLWTPATVLNVLSKLAQLEKRTRTTSLPTETILYQAFLSLALYAQKSISLR